MFQRLREFLFGTAATSAASKAHSREKKAVTEDQATPETLPHLLAVESVVDNRGHSAGKFVRLRPHGASARTASHTLHEDSILLQSVERILDHHGPRNGHVLLIELGPASLSHPIMGELAQHHAMLLLAPGAMDQEKLARLKQLKSEGLRLALWQPGSWPGALLALADGFVFSFAGRSPVDAAELVEKIHHIMPRAALIAVDIAWREEYAWCRTIGCHFVAGRLFHDSQWPDSPIDSGFMHILGILNKVRNDAEPAEIALALKADPLLSFRLLAQANSAAQGLSHKVSGIEQAVVVVGRTRLYRWLVLLLFIAGKTAEDSPILQEMAQVRAELMVRLGARYLPGEEEGLYLTGLFSMLDALIQRPLQRILAEVEVPATVNQALLEHSGPYAPFLALAEAAEQNSPPPPDLLAACGISPVDFNRCLLEALLAVESEDLRDEGQTTG